MALPIDRETIYRLVFSPGATRRFTQDSPVLADVWASFAEAPAEPIDLLLTPFQSDANGVRPPELASAIRERMAANGRPGQSGSPPDERRWQRTRAACNRTTLVAQLTFPELVRCVLPLSSAGAWLGTKGDERRAFLFDRKAAIVATLDRAAEDAAVRRDRRLPRSASQKRASEVPSERAVPPAVPEDVLWAVRVIGSIAYAHSEKGEASFASDLKRLYEAPTTREDARKLGSVTHPKMVEALASLVDGIAPPPERAPLLHSVSLNRRAGPTVSRSRRCIKADAAELLFATSCKDLTWAVIDSGIDATHPAFRLRDSNGCPEKNAFDKDAAGTWINRTRVVASYDFRLIRDLLSADPNDRKALPADLRSRPDVGSLSRSVREQLNIGQDIDWSALRPFLEIPTDAAPERRRPPTPHGTHVAGILAGDWRVSDAPPGRSPLKADVVGVCRDLRLIDLRVFDADGEGDEFTVMSALQFVRWLNAHTDHMVVHGVNLSLSIPHEARNYACGQTPVCDECERLVGAGLVVVVAAGNQGSVLDEGGRVRTYDASSITDPGNSEAVITVGATHRESPHAYGVSYFSSRGPTGDGRAKPDLVAPGEKITAPLPEGALGARDGTSMAAPHVSGAAALLMARHRELIGRPARIKQILCATATDLGRERYFQGAGLLDVLRAIQSI